MKKQKEILNLALNILRENADDIADYETGSSSEIYFNPSGKYKGQFFSVILSYRPLFFNEPKIEFTSSTDCTNELKELLRDYKDYFSN